MASFNESIQYLAWFTALVEFILGLYVLALNYRHIANQYVSGFLLIYPAGIDYPKRFDPSVLSRLITRTMLIVVNVLE